MGYYDGPSPPQGRGVASCGGDSLTFVVLSLPPYQVSNPGLIPPPPQVSSAPSSEAWAPGILPMTAQHPDLGPLGTVYLELCSR